MGVQKALGSSSGSTGTPVAADPQFEDKGPGPGDVVTDPVEYSLDPFGGMGYTSRGKPIASLEQMLPHLVTGRSIDNPNGVISYTFNDVGHLVGLFNNPKYEFTASIGFSEYSESQENAAREAMSLWDDVLAVTFRESKGMGADIVFSNSSDPAQAYAYYPLASGGQKFGSDVFTRNPSENFTNEWFTPGGYGNTTLIHEVGHTIGLSHPGRYNGSGATTYLNQAEYAQDSMQYSIMSYWSGSETGALTANWNMFVNNYAQTPMLHDIYAAQTVYGADMTTRTGDNVYGFGSNSGHWQYDFAANPYPYMSIWDAGGNDTIDASGFTVSQFINLTPGSFSSMGAGAPTVAQINANRVAEGFAPIANTQAQVNATVASYQNAAAARIQSFTGVAGITATAHDNVSIAYGVTIENAIGGSGRDLLWGNAVGNRLEGRAGSDVLNGFAGDDVLIGGDGSDTLTGGTGRDTFVFDSKIGTDTVTDFAAGDSLDLHLLAGNLSYVGGAAFSGVAGQVRYAGGTVSIDFDGNGVGDMNIVLSGTPALLPDQLILHG